MPPTLTMAPGLSAWSVTLATGETRTILASSMRAAIGSLPVTACTKGAGFVPGGPGTTPPVLTALVPNSAVLGSANFALHVQGTGFRVEDVILWNGGAEPTTFVSATELTTGVNMATAQVAIPLPVAVRRLTGVESNALTFTLLPAGAADDTAQWAADGPHDGPEAGGAAQHPTPSPTPSPSPSGPADR